MFRLHILDVEEGVVGTGEESVGLLVIVIRESIRGVGVSSCIELGVDIWERNKELIRKRMDIGEHFTREIIQSIVFIFLPLGERVHLTNWSITTNL